MSDEPEPLILHRGTPEVIVLHGGLPDEPGHAVAGEHCWRQLPDETPEQFGDRAIVAATASREPWLVFGGLPD